MKAVFKFKNAIEAQYAVKTVFDWIVPTWTDGNVIEWCDPILGRCRKWLYWTGAEAQASQVAGFAIWRAADGSQYTLNASAATLEFDGTQEAFEQGCLLFKMQPKVVNVLRHSYTGELTCAE